MNKVTLALQIVYAIVTYVISVLKMRTALKKETQIKAEKKAKDIKDAIKAKDWTALGDSMSGRVSDDQGLPPDN